MNPSNKGSLNKLTPERLAELGKMLPAQWRGPGRPPERIPAMLLVLSDVWKRYPDLRLGQLIENVCTGTDLYNVEDDVLMTRLTTYYPEGGFGGR